MKIEIMNKVLIILFGILFNINLTFAGGWQCILVKVYIETDSETIIGYIEFGEDYWQYDENNLLNHLFGDTLKVYDTIYNLNYPIVEGYKLTASLDEDKRKIPTAKIKNISCISKGPCQEWRPERKEGEGMVEEYNDSYYAWTGIYVPIVELTKDEINLLQSKPLFSIQQAPPFYDNELETFYIVSYSETMSKDEVFRKIKDAVDAVINYSGNRPIYHVHKEAYQKLKIQLREHKVIIFSISETA